MNTFERVQCYSCLYQYGYGFIYRITLDLSKKAESESKTYMITHCKKTGSSVDVEVPIDEIQICPDFMSLKMYNDMKNKTDFISEKEFEL